MDDLLFFLAGAAAGVMVYSYWEKHKATAAAPSIPPSLAAPTAGAPAAGTAQPIISFF